MPDPRPRPAPPQPKGRITQAAGTARDQLQDAGERTVEIIEENPLAVLAGGLAVGALVAALIPTARREVRLLAPVGRQITDRAKTAVNDVKDTAKERLGALGDGVSEATQGSGTLVQGLLTALATAGLNALQQSGRRAGERPSS